MQNGWYRNMKKYLNIFYNSVSYKIFEKTKKELSQIVMISTQTHWLSTWAVLASVARCRNIFTVNKSYFHVMSIYLQFMSKYHIKF